MNNFVPNEIDLATARERLKDNLVVYATPILGYKARVIKINRKRIVTDSLLSTYITNVKFSSTPNNHSPLLT